MLAARLHGSLPRTLARTLALVQSRRIKVATFSDRTAATTSALLGYRDTIYQKWSDAAKDIQFKDRPSDRTHVATPNELSALQERLG